MPTVLSHSDTLNISDTVDDAKAPVKASGPQVLALEPPHAKGPAPVVQGQPGLATLLGAKLGLWRAYPPRIYTNQWALITGASSGIGASLAEELAKRGANVLLAARSEDKLRTLAERLTHDYPVRAEVLVADLAKPHAARDLMSQIEKRGLQVDVLVNNAGFSSYGRFEDTDPQRQHDMINVNIASTTELARACLPGMQARRQGTIINVASIAAFQPMPYMASYGASKAYLLNFSESLWAENRTTGVRVLALCPGATDTAFFEGAGMGNPEASLGSLASSQSVVDEAFKAVEEDQCYVISNTRDYWKVQPMRWLPRGIAAMAMEKIFRP